MYTVGLYHSVGDKMKMFIMLLMASWQENEWYGWCAFLSTLLCRCLLHLFLIKLQKGILLERVKWSDTLLPTHSFSLFKVCSLNFAKHSTTAKIMIDDCVKNDEELSCTLDIHFDQVVFFF